MKTGLMPEAIELTNTQFAFKVVAAISSGNVTVHLFNKMSLSVRGYIPLAMQLVKRNTIRLNLSHSSLVSPTIMRPRVRIPTTPSKFFSICIIEIVMRK